MNLPICKAFLVAILICLGCYSQAQELKQPSEGKCIVYFTRTSGLGLLIGFRIFDETGYIGTLKAGRAIAYECNPGEHAFIAKAENKDFVAATLAEGHTYIVEVEAKMGIAVARVKFTPVEENMKHYNHYKKRALRLLSDNPKITFVSSTTEVKDKEDDIYNTVEESTEGTLQKFEKRKKEGMVTLLTEEMYFDPLKTAEKPKKKSKKYAEELYD